MCNQMKEDITKQIFVNIVNVFLSLKTSPPRIMHQPKRTIKDGILIYENPKGEHWYRSEKSKAWYPSVTMITGIYPKGAGFARWLGNAESLQDAERIRDEAGARGTRVHHACEALLNNEPITFDDYMTKENLNFTQAVDEWQCLQGFIRWTEDHQPEMISTETTVLSEVHKYGGTFDLACKIDGEIHIVDFKTSSAIYPSHFLQVQAYAWAASEMKLIEGTPRISVLQFNKRTKTGYKFESHEWSTEEFSAFKACQELWQHSNPKFTGPKTLELTETLSLQAT